MALTITYSEASSNLPAYLDNWINNFDYYVNDNEEFKGLADKNNSPIQLISQLRGFFYINPVLAISLAITIFSFAGIPPLIGFFAKQMVLSAALDSGYIFLALVGILTSVIGAVYYLNIIKQIFFYETEYKINPLLADMNLHGNIVKDNILVKPLSFKADSIKLSSSLTITISVLTLITILFMFVSQEVLSLANILALTLFNP